jgi:hypothetical protein
MCKGVGIGLDVGGISAICRRLTAPYPKGKMGRSVKQHGLVNVSGISVAGL